MRIAVCPGSFDPVTLGHLDIIDRASKLFDKVIVLVSFNANKSRAAFTPTERMEMIIEVTKHLDNVVVDCYNGLLADYLQKTAKWKASPCRTANLLNRCTESSPIKSGPTSLSENSKTGISSVL